MTSEKESKLKEALKETLTGIQKRWGEKAIQRLGEKAVSVPTLSTGFAELDQAMGGIPRGRISEIIGIPTSGMATLALKVIAGAQAKGGVAIYLDAGRTFDPDYAHRCGVHLDQLFLVRVSDNRQAIDILPDFIANGGMDVFVFDLPWLPASESALLGRLATTLGRLIAPLAQSGCALLFLTTLPPGTVNPLDDYPAHATLPHYAAIRLLLQKERWLYRRRDIMGYETQVLVVKNKLAPADRRAHIAIAL